MPQGAKVTSRESRVCEALDRMIASVLSDLKEQDPGNHATIGSLQGELKGLQAAKGLVSIQSETQPIPNARHAAYEQHNYDAPPSDKHGRLRRFYDAVASRVERGDTRLESWDEIDPKHKDIMAEAVEECFPVSAERPCTCHPDEAPVPCQRKYALSECLQSARSANGATDILKEVAASGVSFEDQRVGYVEVQISRPLWEEIQNWMRGTERGTKP